VVIYPHVASLGLTPLEDLRHKLPTVHARLEGGRFWNKAAEWELLRLLLDG
jgi:hypothetical protein